MDKANTDRIEREVFIRAPVERVWRALTDPREFGAWFGVEAKGEFKPGARVRKTMKDASWEILIERIEKPALVSWRWSHFESFEDAKTYFAEPGADVLALPTTLVEFRLEEVDDGTRLTVVESGFDKLPPGLAAVSFPRNSEGWRIQMGNIERYVSANP